MSWFKNKDGSRGLREMEWGSRKRKKQGESMDLGRDKVSFGNSGLGGRWWEKTRALQQVCSRNHSQSCPIWAAYLKLLVLQLRVPWHEKIMSCGYIIPWGHHTYLFCILSPYLDSQFLFVTTGWFSGYHLFLFFMFICPEHTAPSMDHPSKPCLKRKRINIQTIFWKLGVITELYKWCHVAWRSLAEICSNISIDVMWELNEIMQ